MIKSFFKKYFFLIDQKKRELPVIFIFLILLSFLELMGLGLIGPYMNILFDEESSNPSILTKIFLFENHESAVLFWGSLTIFLFMGKNFFAWFLQRKIIIFSYEQEYALRNRISNIFLNLSLENIQESSSSEYINIITRHISQYTNQILLASLKLFVDGIAMIAVLIFLVIFNPTATFLLAFILILTISIYQAIVRDRIVSSGASQADSFTQIIRLVSSIIKGTREISVYGVKNHFSSKLLSESHKNQVAYTTYTSLQMVPRYLIEVILMISLISLSYILFKLSQSTAETFAMLSVYAVAAVRLMPAFLTLTNSVNNILNGQKIFNELFEFTKKLETGKLFSDQNNNLNNLKKIKFEHLSVEDLSFRYTQDSNNILEDVNLKIQEGETIGLMGASGSGKTSFINLLLGLSKPTSGTIKVNNFDINDLKIDWVASTAYIPQEKFLIDDTIISNIALGVPKDQINHEKINYALQVSSLKNFIASIPEGVNTSIGEDGSKLSGGQKQRICLARAIYFDRDFIIMDEATSALDSDTENEIVKEIKMMKGVKTFLIIAHRESTIENCDKVFRIENKSLIQI